MGTVEKGLVSSIEGNTARIVVPARNDYVTAPLKIPEWFFLPEYLERYAALKVGDEVYFFELADFSGATISKV